jgi:hypothetical protein
MLPPMPTPVSASQIAAFFYTLGMREAEEKDYAATLTNREKNMRYAEWCAINGKFVSLFDPVVEKLMQAGITNDV